MLFWMAYEELKTEQNQKIVDEKTRSIYHKYISILSPKEVNIDNTVSDEINRKMVIRLHIYLMKLN